MQKTSLLKIISGFAILFIIYHAAEYMILFKNSASGFFLFQIFFFLSAWIIARWQKGKGFHDWGMTIQKKMIPQLTSGLLLGFIMYGLYFIICLHFQVEKITAVPSLKLFLWQFCYLGFGTAFSSLSEDILTRAYLYKFLNNKINKILLIIISSLVYLANHIYRLQDGWPVWLYLFIIGIFLMTALINTGNIWLTFGLHWSGNMVYHSTNSIINTQNSIHHSYGIYIYILFLALLIPFTISISKNKYCKNETPSHQQNFEPGS